MNKPLWITACDEAFRPILEQHFLSSFRSTGMEWEFELQLGQIPSTYGNFGSDEYNISYLAGLEAVLQTIRNNPDRLVVWSDTDLRFFRNLTSEIKDLSKWYELSTAQDSPTQACTGFMFFRATPAIEDFFRSWIELTKNQKWAHAQESYNALLDRSSLDVLRLPPTFWTIGLSGGKCEWATDNLADIPDPPRGIRLHHGNFTRGVSKKLSLMNEISRRVAARQ